jgi:predicted SprT family Zn-dependent metalloprotease
MEEKLIELFEQCLKELKSIGIDMKDEEKIGAIQITLSKRNNKRYGCCKQENPDKAYMVIYKRGRHKVIEFEKYNKHTIEISKWLMELEDFIIKNTIMHELIHCIPFCNNHKTQFKKYAKYINEKLGYDIKRVGNKKEDYAKSNKQLIEENTYPYKIICKQCGQTFYRKRFSKKLLIHYLCGKCGGKLVLEKQNKN